jgi:hypothetical protein
MKKIRSLAFASWFVLSVASALAMTITENFSSDPAADGWKIFGDTSAFAWDSASHNLAVTWDSRRTNSYFYHPLGTVVTRDDDFSIAFDLNLSDIASGIEPGKTGPLQIGFGFLNYANATSTSFMRGGWGSAPNVAEFDYYPHGYYTNPFYDAPAATVPSFISGVDSYAYCPNFLSPFDAVLPVNQAVHVTMTFTASNQTAVVTLMTNGVVFRRPPALVLSQPNGFLTNDNFFADTFSISSYSSFGDDFDSVLAHGTVGNLVVTVPSPPVQNLSGSLVGGQWQVNFLCQNHWRYALERTTDFQSWSQVDSHNSTSANAALTLVDANAAGRAAFYRVRADRP